MLVVLRMMGQAVVQMASPVASHSSSAYLYSTVPAASDGSKIGNLKSKIATVPVFFQHQINEHTRLGIWKIEEPEQFFKNNVPLHRDVTHPHKRLQHLAGRFLLQYLFPDFPYHLIEIADTKKPYLPGEEYHFSISHCGDYAAAIVSRDQRVGIDIELPEEKITRIAHKFLNVRETVFTTTDIGRLTMLWSAKEAVFKWYGEGKVDFREHIKLTSVGPDKMDCWFAKTDTNLVINYRQPGELVLAWVVS